VFKIGDEVMCISPPDGNKNLVGKIGIISSIKNTGLPIHVEFGIDKRKANTGWWCEKNSLCLIPKSKEDSFWKDVMDNVQKR